MHMVTLVVFFVDVVKIWVMLVVIWVDFILYVLDVFVICLGWMFIYVVGYLLGGCGGLIWFTFGCELGFG